MKDDCEDKFHLRLQSQGCIFQNNPGGMVLCVHADTCTSAYTHRDTDAGMDVKHRENGSCVWAFFPVKETR